MDSSDCDTETSPTSLDISRMNNFLGNGYASNISPVVNSSGVATVTWDDYSYGELHYRVTYQKYS